MEYERNVNYLDHSAGGRYHHFMKLAISTCWDYSIPLDKSLELIKTAGFSLISLGGKESHSRFNKPEGRENIVRLCEKFGVEVDSVHAPFGSMVDISEPEEVLRHSAEVEVARSIKACAELGTKTLILHISGFKLSDISARMKQVRKSLDSLLGLAERVNVRIAAENPGNDLGHTILKYALDIFDTPVLGLCFDNGHAGLNEDDFKILSAHSERLYAVHLHDNDGTRDQHLLPFEGNRDLPNLAAQMNKIKKLCPITVESEVTNSSCKTPEAFLPQAYKAATRFMEMLKHD